MIRIGTLEIDVAGIITVVTSIAAAAFSLVTLVNQMKSRLLITTDGLPLNNNPIFLMGKAETGNLTISNVGYRAVTVVDVLVGVGNEKISVGCLFDFEKINIPIAPGEVKYYQYDRNALIQYLANSGFSPKKKIKWAVRTNTGKWFFCETGRCIHDVIDVNKEGKR